MLSYILNMYEIPFKYSMSRLYQNQSAQSQRIFGGTHHWYNKHEVAAFILLDSARRIETLPQNGVRDQTKRTRTTVQFLILVKNISQVYYRGTGCDRLGSIFTDAFKRVFHELMRLSCLLYSS